MRRVALLVSFIAVAACAGSIPPPPRLVDGHAVAAIPFAPTDPAASAARATGAPATPRRPAQETFHGVTVADDLLWLRDKDDAAVRPWLDAQNEHASQVIAASPSLEELRRRFDALLKGDRPALKEIVATPAGFFGLRRAPGAQQSSIVLLESLEKDSPAKTVLAPDVLDPTGLTSIDWYVPSPDGKRIAVALSKNGSESGELSLFDVATGQPLDAPLPRVQFPTGGGSAAWSRDGSEIFVTRYPAPGDKPTAELMMHQALFRHRVGASTAKDERVLGDGLPKIAEIELRTHAGGVVVARVKNGDGGDLLWFVARPGKRGALAFEKLADLADEVHDVAADNRGALYVVSRRSAIHGKVLRIAAGKTLADATVVVPEVADRELTHVETAGDGLYVFDVDDGSDRLRAFDVSGKARGEAKLPDRRFALEPATVSGKTLYVRGEGYRTPAAVYAVDPASLALKPTAVAAHPPASFDDIEVSDDTATSKDGTVISMTMLRRAGAPKGPAPTVLYGYGGYSIALEPTLPLPYRVFFDQGGVLARAHLRGGSDRGEAWHRAGKLLAKQNVFDDFAACAEALVAKGWTTKDKLALWGRSNGGLLVSATIAQHPDLARAAIIGVPIADMVHFEDWPNGVFNTTEFGTREHKEEAEALFKYSPYHHLERAAYPAVLVVSGATDGRVNPSDAWRLTARLQERTTSGRPVILRTWFENGHGMGAPVSQRAEEAAQTWAFLFRELGVVYAPPR